MKLTLKITGDVARNAICRKVMEAPEGYAVTIGEISDHAASFSAEKLPSLALM